LVIWHSLLTHSEIYTLFDTKLEHQVPQQTYNPKMACSGGESSGGVSFVALDALLAAAQEQLEVGQMVQSSTFSLFDAMSAVEVGNPKMDAGARPKADQAPLAARALPLDLSKRHLVAWMDRLLSLEATWHVGGALAQTVYASLHMMQLGRCVAFVCLFVCLLCVERGRGRTSKAARTQRGFTHKTNAHPTNKTQTQRSHCLGSAPTRRWPATRAARTRSARRSTRSSCRAACARCARVFVCVRVFCF
jgi:hypothetical protein